MGKIDKVGSLEISHDPEFQRRSWTVQRVGWALMVLVSVAALLGLFGRGPLSSAHVGDNGSPLRADYERFVRLDAPAELTVHIAGAAIRPDSTAELWLDRKWLSDMEVKTITPQPETTRTGAKQVVYSFNLDPAASPGVVTFKLETRSAGRIDGRIGLVNGPSYAFSQFSYP